MESLLRIARDIREAVPAPPPAPRSEREESAPELFDLLVTNQLLRDASRALFMDRHYTRAVEEAFKALNGYVKTRSGLSTVDGVPLMEQAFAPGNPRLRVNRLRSQSDRDEQLGYQLIFRGCMLGIRNPRAHDHLLADERDDALSLLMIANHLFNVAASATRTRRPRATSSLARRQLSAYR